MTEQDEYQLRVSKFIHKTFVDTYNEIDNQVSENFSDLSDPEKWLVLSRIFNRAYVHFNAVSFTSVINEVMNNGDL
jgi:hypothetical protein